MRFSEFDLKEDFDFEILPQNLDPVKNFYQRIGKEYQRPVRTKVKNIVAKETGKFPGIYLMYGTDVDTGNFTYFYIGLSTTKIVDRFETHYPKLKQNAKDLFYRKTNATIEPVPQPRRKGHTWENPNIYRAGVAKQFYGGKDMPDYRIPMGDQEFVSTKGKNKGKSIKHVMMAPGDLTYVGVPVEGRNVDDLPVVLFDLTGWTKKQIDALESFMIQEYRPVFNNSKTGGEPEIDYENLAIQASQEKLAQPKPNKIVKSPTAKIAKPPAQPNLLQTVNDTTTTIGRYYSNLNSLRQSTFLDNFKKAIAGNKDQSWIENHLNQLTQSTFNINYS